MIRDCVVCGGPFDTHSPAKLRVGGKITQCSECSDEPAVRYLGLAAGDGKQAGVTILKFDSHEDREEYRQMWWVNSGMMVGKACQMGYSKRTPNIKFKTVTQATATNHKGRA